MSSCARVIDEAVAVHRKWLAQAEQFVERQRGYLGEDLSDLGSALPANVADAARGLGYYWGVRGVIGAWDDEARSSLWISRSVDYYLWSLLIRSHDVRVEGPGFENHVGVLASVVCFGLAYGDEQISEPAAHLLLNVATSRRLMDPQEWVCRRFERFALRLWALSRGKNLPSEPGRSLGDVYEPLLAPSTNAAAVGRACDYHCANMDDRAGDRIPAFANPPFDLIPVEVLAVLRVRGSEMETPDHPLLNTRIRSLAPHAVSGDDPELKMLQSYYAALELAN